MKILITGSQGYVGSALVNYIKNTDNKIEIDGLDLGFFQNLTHYSSESSDFNLKNLKFMDLRDVSTNDLEIYDAIVHLAAISNDPIGDKFSKITNEINFNSTLDLCNKAKKVGIKKFIFASSASVYGFSDTVCKENSPLNPLTAYAKSKAMAEAELKKISDRNFQITCLRFATAAGWSKRLRSDIALNNFVIQAVLKNKIELNSSGDSFRPFVDVQDMSKAILFCLSNQRDLFSNFEIYNIGQNSWNFRILDLANMVAESIKETTINLNLNLTSDSRSYYLNFDKFNSIAGEFSSTYLIQDTIKILQHEIEKIMLLDSKEYFDRIVRLKSIEILIKKGVINSDLRFN